MKNTPLVKLSFIIVSIIFFLSCQDASSDRNSNQNISDIEEKNKELETQVQILRDSIKLLKYPAPNRLSYIKELLSENKFDGARNQIAELRTLFPKSEEALFCDKLESEIKQKIELIRAEEERIKALGYKVFKDNTSGQVDFLTYNLSGFTFGRTFTFDSCSDVGEYSYDTADKDNVYLLMSANISSKEKHGAVPDLGLYAIENGNLKKISSVREEYASWTSYGAKIGNYSDDSHDFSKVNTVKYKLAAEISIEQSKQPLLLLVAKERGLVKESLTIEEVKNYYIVVKIINRNKL